MLRECLRRMGSRIITAMVRGGGLIADVLSMYPLQQVRAHARSGTVRPLRL